MPYRKSEATASESSSIRVISLDMDGCLFHPNYNFATEEDKSVIDHNPILLETLKQDNLKKPYSKIILFVGSNRQSASIDANNMLRFDRQYGPYTTGSCFPVIIDIANALGSNVQLDPLLLADIHGNLEAGTSFALAMKDLSKYYMMTEKGRHTWSQTQLREDASVMHKVYNIKAHADYWFDNEKVSLLYAQMHKIASENPTETIEFHFYDDVEYILNTLNDFYNKHNILIPKNVILQLHQYQGGQLTVPNPYASLTGTGNPDPAYRQTVRKMWQIALSRGPIKTYTTQQEANTAYEALAKKYAIQSTQIHTCAYVTPDLLGIAAPTVDVVLASQSQTTASAALVENVTAMVTPIEDSSTVPIIAETNPEQDACAANTKMPYFNTHQFTSLQPSESDLSALKLDWSIEHGCVIDITSLDCDMEFLKSLSVEFQAFGVKTFLNELPQTMLTIFSDSTEQVYKALIESGIQLADQVTSPAPSFFNTQKIKTISLQPPESELKKLQLSWNVQPYQIITIQSRDFDIALLKEMQESFIASGLVTAIDEQPKANPRLKITIYPGSLEQLRAAFIAIGFESENQPSSASLHF